MIFKPRNKEVNNLNLDIKLNNQNVQLVQSTKFLGVNIDDNLTWCNHVNYIVGKICYTIGILSKLRSFVPLRILTNLYNALILPHLSYCNIVWGN